MLRSKKKKRTRHTSHGEGWVVLLLEKERGPPASSFAWPQSRKRGRGRVFIPSEEKKEKWRLLLLTRERGKEEGAELGELAEVLRRKGGRDTFLEKAPSRERKGPLALDLQRRGKGNHFLRRRGGFFQFSEGLR